MKTKQYFILTTILLTSFGLRAQDDRPVKVEQDGVSVTYQFDELKGKKAEMGPKDLCLFITNNNDYPVEIKFSLAFFEDGFVNEESDVLELCADAGKTLKGKKLGLCWLITEENDDKMKEDAFDWGLNELTVTKVEECD